MRIHGGSTLATVVWLSMWAAASQAAIEIEHESVPCAVAGEYPRIVARIQPTGPDTVARVFFHGGDATRWYAVSMERKNGEWVASLPRPRAAGGRFAYSIRASGTGTGGRAPGASAWVVDVRAACAGPHLATTTKAPTRLQVPPGAALVPDGFDGDGIGGFVELAGEDPPALPVRAAPFWTSRLLPLSQVRVETVPPPEGGGAPLQEGRDWVTVGTPAGGSATFSRRGEILHGRIASFEQDAVVLSVDDDERVRIRREDIARLEVREPGSPALGVVGALAGAGAGFLLAVLACSNVGCDSAGVVWLGTGAGAAVGAAVGGSSSWRSVTLVREDAWSLELHPQPEGGSVRVAVRF